MGEGEHLGDGTAHRVPAHDHPIEPGGVEEGHDPVGIGLDGEEAGPRRPAMPGQVDGEEARHVGQPLELGAPQLAASTRAVDEDERPAGARFPAARWPSLDDDPRRAGRVPGRLQGHRAGPPVTGRRRGR